MREGTIKYGRQQNIFLSFLLDGNAVLRVTRSNRKNVENALGGWRGDINTAMRSLHITILRKGRRYFPIQGL